MHMPSNRAWDSRGHFHCTCDVDGARCGARGRPRRALQRVAGARAEAHSPLLDDELHVLHLQRESADGPLEALEVGDEAGVAEIANVLVALF